MVARKCRFSLQIERKSKLEVGYNLPFVFHFPNKRFCVHRFDPISRSVETGYPKLISQGWPGASAPIDAAISLVNGTVFFFKEHTVLTFHPPICRGNKSFLSNIQYSSKFVTLTHFSARNLFINEEIDLGGID